MEVKVNAYAKINLMLDIIAKRTDSYHDLFMVMQSVSTHDIVTVSENRSKTITISCKTEGIPLDEKKYLLESGSGLF